MMKGLGVDLGSQENKQIHLAVEGLQNYSIILDDIQDQDELRRGIKTVHEALAEEVDDERLGELLTTNQAIRLNTKSYRPITRLESLEPEEKIDILEILWDAEEKLGRGQNLDLQASRLTQKPREGFFNPEVTDRLSYENQEFDFLEMEDEKNYLKTGALFEASARIASYLSDLEDVEENLVEYSVKTAKAFQIRDDMLDFLEDHEEIGKDTYSDFAEGRITTPIYFAVRYLESHPKDFYTDRAEYILEVLSDEDPDQKEIENAAELVKYTPAIEAANNLCNKLIDDAIESLNQIDWEKEKYSDELKDLAIYGGLARGN